MSDANSKNLSFYGETLTKTAQRTAESKAFMERWSPGKTGDDLKEVQIAAETIRKGYWRMSAEGTLVVTWKGIWRELVRQERGEKIS